jgi:hypothetical protein
VLQYRNRQLRKNLTETAIFDNSILFMDLNVTAPRPEEAVAKAPLPIKSGNATPMKR